METLKRTIVAFTFFPFLLFAIFFNGWFFIPFLIIALLFSIFMTAEYLNLFKDRIFLSNKVLSVIFSVLFIIPFYLVVLKKLSFSQLFFAILILLFNLTFLSFLFNIFRKNFDNTVNSIVYSIFPIFYIVMPIGFLLLYRRLDFGSELIVFILSITWMTDAFAYFTGRLIGKHQIGLAISPKKTTEGFIGAIIFGTLSGWIFTLIFPEVFSSIFFPIVIAFVLSIITILADMFESLIKRNVGIKDSSHIIPGHGGLLDAFDSMLFTLPIGYFLFYFVHLIDK